ncbi:MAG: hypothetical protein HC880_12975, partial [Bacteroidia bacterium]|nr:hypothetical protein [Bacteroidia bacterium]
LDQSGRLYIVDAENHCIRSVDLGTGIIQTLVVTEKPVTTVTPAQPARRFCITPAELPSMPSIIFTLPMNVNNRVRKINAQNGQILSLAGNGTEGYFGDQGPATQAALYNPERLRLDSAGNVYIVDEFNNRVRKVDARTGMITTIAGNGKAAYQGDGGPATEASLNHPEGIALDNQGNIYIADKLNHCVRKVEAATGFIYTVAGNNQPGFTGDRGLATQASLFNPIGLAIDAQANLYIADELNHRIRKVDAQNGIITTIAGDGAPRYHGDGGLAVYASFQGPADVMLDKQGNLYISDRDNHRIRKMDAQTGIIQTIVGNGIPGSSGDGGVATAARLNYPFGLSLDEQDNLYIADALNHRIRKLDAASGLINTLVGTGNSGFEGDGRQATDAHLEFPTGIAVDSKGNLYIADQDNNRVRNTYEACTISAITLGEQTPCDPQSNGYIQQIILEYENVPPDAQLEVNGQRFAVLPSPMSLWLSNLPADGQAVSLNARFTTDDDCSFQLANFFQAPPSCEPPLKISHFSLINAATGEIIPGYDSIPEQAVIDVFQIPALFSIQAHTEPALVGSVKFEIKGAGIDTVRLENAAPYALFGDSQGRYTAWNGEEIQLGSVYTISATPFVESGGQGQAGRRVSLNLSFTALATIKDFTLIDAQRDVPVAGYDPMPDSVVLDLARIPQHFSIRANVSPDTVASIRMEIYGTEELIRAEEIVPYSVFSDDGGNYQSWEYLLTPPRAGSTYLITATPYTMRNARGISGKGRSLYLSFINSNIQGSKLIVHPNPGPGVFLLSSADKTTEECNFYLYNERGALVMRKNGLEGLTKPWI